MFEFEQNINRKLTKDERKVYEAFLKVVEIFKKGEYDKNLEDNVFYFGDVKCFIDNKHRNIVAFMKTRALSTKDIEFSVKFEDVDGRYVFLAREHKGKGNGSYYVYDKLLDRVVYKEDD